MDNYHEIISLHGASPTGFFYQKCFSWGEGGAEGQSFLGIFLGGGILHGGGTNGQIHAK